MVLSFFHEMGSKTVRSCRSPPPVFGRTEQTNVKFHAQFLAVCRSSILAETLGYAASFASPWRGKRRVVERRKSLLMDQLQLSANSDKLSVASRAKRGEYVTCFDHFDLLQTAIN